MIALNVPTGADGAYRQVIQVSARQWSEFRDGGKDMDSSVLLQIVEMGISEIVPIEQLVVKLKNYFTLNPDVTISIQNLESQAIQADDDTIAMIAKWQADHGLPVTVQPPAPGSVTQISSSTPSGSAPSSTSGPAPTTAAQDGAAVGSAPDAAASASSWIKTDAAAGSSTDAPAAGAPGVTGEHGEIGDTGDRKN